MLKKKELTENNKFRPFDNYFSPYRVEIWNCVPIEGKAVYLFYVTPENTPDRFVARIDYPDCLQIISDLTNMLSVTSQMTYLDKLGRVYDKRDIVCYADDIQYMTFPVDPEELTH